MEGNLFLGLPPPSESSASLPVAEKSLISSKEESSSVQAPVLKSALKRSNPSQPAPTTEVEVPQKRIRFKTTVDASVSQIIEAMQKIASHIKNPSKFSKASKLAIQLIQAGSVKEDTSEHFYAILEAAMSSPTSCTDPSLRADYHDLFLAAQDASDCLSKNQKAHLTTWIVRAVLANDLYTDDSFVFSKASGKIRESISNLPTATEVEDMEEAESLANIENGEAEAMNEKEDPFGLDALLPDISKKDERSREKKDFAGLNKKSEDEHKKFLKSQREALISCLEIAARRYRIPWTQTVIDILVKHAFDNREKFTSQQRDAIEKLWASIREQQIRRKQGKSVTGKLDMNGFEWLQEKYSHQKISIRHSVGADGDRRAQQWLG